MHVEKKGPDFEGLQFEVKMVGCPLGNGELPKQGREMTMLGLQQHPFSGCVEVSQAEELTPLYRNSWGLACSKHPSWSISTTWEHVRNAGSGASLKGLNHFNESPRKSEKR